MDTTPLTADVASTPDNPTIWRVDDALWAILAPILASDKVRTKPGRPRRDDRPIFDGLIWLARTGSQWAALPREFGPKPTVHERFREWVETGKLEQAWGALLAAYDDALGLDWSWVAADGCIVKAPFGKRGSWRGGGTGRNPTDRSKPGTKRHLLTEARGIPIATVITGANRHDMKRLAALLDAVLAERPEAIVSHLVLDRGYDYAACREVATERGDVPHIPPKASAAHPLPAPDSPDRHPARRWVVEVGHSWFNRFRRLLTRWEKRGAYDLGFVQLAAILIIYRKIRHARALSG